MHYFLWSLVRFKNGEEPGGGRLVSMVSYYQPKLSPTRGDRGVSECKGKGIKKLHAFFKSHPKILKLQPGVAAWAKAFFLFFVRAISHAEDNRLKIRNYI